MRKRGAEEYDEGEGEKKGGDDGLERVEERKRKWNKIGGEVGRRGPKPSTKSVG